MNKGSLHDAYAASYDAQIQAYDCYIADLLFGLCYEYLAPGQTLLDLGIGSGLSALPFAQAGLQVSGMDFSPAMLAICKAKGFTGALKQHDLQEMPWPYPSASFDILVCCGVFHFIAGLEAIFDEARRVLKPGGVLAFTTRAASAGGGQQKQFERLLQGEFEIFSHQVDYLDRLLEGRAFTRAKFQRAFVGDDLFNLWVARLA